MPCEVRRFPGGGGMIICSRGRSSKPRCEYPGCTNASEFQCDFPVGDAGRTCDRHCCSAHRASVGWNRDYCWQHKEEKGG